MKSTQPDRLIEKLLESLEQNEDERVGVTLLTGRAVSRSAENVHLAIGGGIVAVPIANIERVLDLGDDPQPNFVRLEVRNPQQIQPLLRVRLRTDASDSARGATLETARDGTAMPNTNRKFKVMVGGMTVTYTDSDTASGVHGEDDQCDDSEVTDETPDDQDG